MRRQYQNPPLREAACEFIFQPGTPWDLANPGLIFSELRDQFPRRIQAPPQPSLSFSVGPPMAAPPLGEIVPMAVQQDLRFWREGDDDGVIIVGPNRLAVSHYRPYPGWDAFREIVQRAYRAYIETAAPALIQRAGLRYINDIPLETPFEPEDYFEYYPHLGERLPGDYSNIRISLDFPFNDDVDRARVQLITLAGETTESLVVRLDVDYSALVPGAVDLNGPEAWLEGAHSVVGELFEGCLTDKTRALFGGEE